MEESKSYHLGIRIDQQTKQDLEKLAKDDNRKMADYARLVLVEHVKTKRKQGKQ